MGEAQEAVDRYMAQLVSEGRFPRPGQPFEAGMMQDPYEQDPILRMLMDDAGKEATAGITPAAISKTARQYRASRYATAVLEKAAGFRAAQACRRRTALARSAKAMFGGYRAGLSGAELARSDRLDSALRAKRLADLDRRIHSANLAERARSAGAI